MKKSDQDSKKSNSESPSKTSDPRRDLLKKLAVGGVAGAAIPSQWSKPVIDSVILPAHAQTTTGTVVGGGGGGGDIGAVTPSSGESLLDYFAAPAHAASVEDYCLEIAVSVSEGVITGVRVLKACFNACKPGVRWIDQEISPVALDGEGTTWAGNVAGFPLLLANVNPNGAVLANCQYGGVNGTINAGVSCDCSCPI